MQTYFYKTGKYTLKLLVACLVLCVFQIRQVSALEPMLEQYQQQAAENNAGLQSIHFKYLAGAEKITQTRLLPEAELSAMYYPQPLEYKMAEQIANVRAVQMFPWFGTRKFLREEASFMSQADFETYQQERNNIFYEVAKTYYDLLALEEKIRLVQANLQLLESIKENVLIRYETGSASMADVIQTDVEIDALQNQLLFFEDQKIPLNNRFAELLNTEAEGFFELPDTLIALSLNDPIENLKDSMLGQHPTIAAYEFTESAYKAKQRSARKSGLPSFGIGAEYMFMRETAEGTGMSNMIMPMVSVRLPFQRGVYKAREQEAQFYQMAASQLVDQAQNKLVSEWEEWVSRYRDAQRRVPLYSRQLQRLEQALNIIMEDYSAGRKSFNDMLEVQRMLLDFELEMVYAKKDNNTAIAGLTYLYQRP